MEGGDDAQGFVGCLFGRRLLFVAWRQSRAEQSRAVWGEDN